MVAVSRKRLIWIASSPDRKLDTQNTNEKSHKSFSLMALRVRPEGLEPPTLGSEDRCSIQLSYGRNYYYKHLTAMQQPAKGRWVTADPTYLAAYNPLSAFRLRLSIGTVPG